MTQPRKKHDNRCSDDQCTCRYDDYDTGNTGHLSLNTDGHMALGIGSGLAIDMSDGSLGIDMGGFTIDIDT